MLRVLNTDQWEKHINGLRDFGILASQASEYEHNKNRTEGKTGIVKPDLIPSKNIESPKKLPNTLIDDAANSKISIRKPSPKTSPRTSPLKLIPEIDISVSTEEDQNKNNEANNCEDKVDLTRHYNENHTKEMVPKSTIASASNDLISAEKHEPVSVETAEMKKPEPVVSARTNGAVRPQLVRSKGSLLACKPPNVLVYSDSSVTRDNVIRTLRDILETD